MELDPRRRMKAFIDRRINEAQRQQQIAVADLRLTVEAELADLRGAIEAVQSSIQAWGDGLASLGHLGHERAMQALAKAESVLGHVDEWGHSLAALGHLGHEQACNAVADVEAARTSLQSLQQQVASSTQRIGSRLFDVESRIRQLEKCGLHRIKSDLSNSPQG